MLRSLLALLLVGAVSAAGGPLDSHPTGGPWSRIADSARHEVALAVLVRDLALTDEQAGKLLDVLRRVERIITGVAAGSAEPATAFRTSMAGFRDRVLATPRGLPGLSRAEIQARQTWEENVGQLDREVQPLREQVGGLLTPAQQKVLRAFSPERTLEALGFDDDDLEEWSQRLIAMRNLPPAGLEETVKEEMADQLQELGHPERLPALIAVIKEARALPPDRFDAALIANARRIKAMLSVKPDAKQQPVEMMDLNEAVDQHLMDMRMIPVLAARRAWGKK